jgi:hypothetical protein
MPGLAVTLALSVLMLPTNPVRPMAAAAAAADEGGATRDSATPVPVDVPGQFLADTTNGTPGAGQSGAGHQCHGGTQLTQCWNNARYWSYSPPADTVMVIRAVSVTPSGWDNTLEVWKKTEDGYAFVYENDDAYGLDAMVAITMDAGETYIIGVGGYRASSKGTATLIFGNEPPETPEITTVTGNNHSARVEWTAPFDNHVAISAYTVYTYLNGDQVGTPKKLYGAPPSTSTTVSGLTNGTTYTFRVSASNLVGESDLSEELEGTPVGPPPSPTDVRAVPGDGKATVSWHAPADATILGYTVTSDPDGKTCTATPPATSCVVSGLTNGTAYTFTVVAHNEHGDGDPSAASAAATPVKPTPTPPAPEPASSPAPSPGPQPTPAPVDLKLDLAWNLSTGVVPSGVPGAGGKAPDPRGAEVTVSGSGLMPNSDVVLELHSTPVHLATVKTDANGAFTTKLRLPKDITPGLHHVVATGTARDGSKKVASTELIVPFPTLPYTGTNTGTLALVAFGLVAAGFALAVIGRPRRVTI